MAAGWTFENRASIHRSAFQYDFVAFYCASSVAQQGFDPYLTEPLRTCEHRIGHAFRADSRLAVPAPVPAYDFYLISPLALLPFGYASFLWLGLQIGAYAATVASLWRLTRLAPALVIAATLLSDAFLSFMLGQLVVFAVLGICLAAEGLRREHMPLTATGLALTAVEPHLALPCYLATGLFVPRSRRWLAATASVFIALSFVELGPRINIEYFVHVLPAHALSEISNQEQYSLSYLIHLLGSDEATAEIGGQLSYAAMTVLALMLIPALRKRLHDDAIVVLLPSAAILVGGTFLHVAQFAAALPLALCLFATMRRRETCIAVVLLAVPWGVFFSLVPFAPVAAFCTAFLIYQFNGGLRVAIGAGLITLSAIVYAELLRPIPVLPTSYAMLPANDGTQLAETTWRFLMSAGSHSAVPLYLAMKIPSWFALAALAVALVKIVYHPQIPPAQRSASERFG